MCAWLSISPRPLCCITGNPLSFARQFDARKKNGWTIDLMTRRETPPPRGPISSVAFFELKETPQLVRGVGHERRKQPGELANGFEKMMKNFPDPRSLRRILKQGKRRGLHDIAVSMIDSSPNRFKGTMKLEFCHVTMQLCLCLSKFIFERLILFWPVAAQWLNNSGEIFVLHREYSADQIPEVVGQVSIVARYKSIFPKICVLPEHALAQHEVTKGIHADPFLHLERRDRVAQAL